MDRTSHNQVCGHFYVINLDTVSLLLKGNVGVSGRSDASTSLKESGSEVYSLHSTVPLRLTLHIHQT